MFKSIFTFECTYWLKKPSIYLYGMAFFALSFLSFAGTAGFFDPPPTANQTERILNSPHEINYLLQYFNKLFLFLLPAIIGASVYKDYKSGIHSILYSFPISKKDYLLGKFISAFGVVAILTGTVGIAILIAEHLPGLHPNKIGEYRLGGYVQAYAVYTLPNMLIFGAIVFSVVVWFRNIYAGFATVILLFFIQIITENAFVGNGYAIALFDPFAQNTVKYITQYWTLEEQNTQFIPVMGVVLFNRLLWLSIATAIFAVIYYKFSMNEHGIAAYWKMPWRKQDSSSSIQIQTKSQTVFPPISYHFSLFQQLKNTWRLSNIHFNYIIQNGMFVGILVLGIMAILFSLAKVTNTGEMNLLPVTRIILTVPAFFFTSIIILLTIIYTGMLMHRERLAGMNELVDTTPIPNGVLLFSKVLAVLKMQLVLLSVFMFAGMLIQLYNGYYHFELSLYLFDLFVLTFMRLSIWAFAAIIVHSLLPNVYLGIFILVLGWIGIGSLPDIGIDSKLLLFNSPKQLIYTDLNGYGNMLKPYLLVEAYWFVFGILLLIASYLFWLRGLPQSISERIKVAGLRFNRPLQIVLAVSIIGFVVLGFQVYRADAKSNPISAKERNKAFKAFEEKYVVYENMVQPKITDMTVEMDLYPASNRFEAKGRYIVVNQSNQLIDTLLIKKGFDERTEFTFSREVALIEEDAYVQFSVWKLSEGLKPTDSLILHFSIQNKPNTFFERNSSVLHNGTLLGADIFPRFGYFLNSAQKYPEDSTASYTNYQAIDADLIQFQATVSTSLDQIAIAPGYLQREWTENGRRYFSYKMDKPIKYLFGFNSGRFLVKREKWKGVELEIYYHEGHSQNLEKMMKGLKSSLAYNQQYFGPFQHQQARIIAFPNSEGSFATTYANSIPTSEIRFIANTDTTAGKIGLSFYVPAHELTHQWWGNQLIPADALGAIMLSESVTEYISLQIYKQEYGSFHASQFLRQQRKRYLNGRTTEQETEPPLKWVKPHQQYIAYGKGAMAFHALGHYVGEERFNGILRDFLEGYKFQAAPYPTSTDLIDHLKQHMPDSLLYLITDMLETVTIYDAKIEAAELSTDEGGQASVAISCRIEKTRLDNGVVEMLPLEEYIEVGVFDQSDKLLVLKSIKMKQNDMHLNLFLETEVAKKAFKVILDPNLLLIDKELADNSKKIER